MAFHGRTLRLGQKEVSGIGEFRGQAEWRSAKQQFCGTSRDAGDRLGDRIMSTESCRQNHADRIMQAWAGGAELGHSR